MSQVIKADLCVIGAGSGGLSVAAGAQQMGARTVLIEGGVMGGECLNSGCVPSKALLAAAHAAMSGKKAAAFGVSFGMPIVNHARVQAHVAEIIAAIAPHDSQERFEGLGVTVIRAWASFVAPDTLEAGSVRVKAKRFVIATGSQPSLPPIPGLGAVHYLTNETIFAQAGAMPDLIVIGGGPIGVELAQAQARLGARVTIVEMGRLMARDDPELVEHVRRALLAEGIAIMETTRVLGVAPAGSGGIILRVAGPDGTERSILGSHLLVATGRQPNLSRLALDKAGVMHSPKGISVDARLRTSNRRVYAVGDCTGGPAFTHAAAYHAGIVLRNILFRLPAKAESGSMPRVTFTDPELAQVGLTEDEARARFPDIRIERLAFSASDRARTERLDEGLIKIVVRPNGSVLGAGIVGARAGELIAPWCLMIAQGLKLSALASLVLPYPTLSELSKRVAGNFYAPRLFGPGVRTLVRFLLRLP
jgi:pyruvate/2-oxoglutarate dehydrogenase complex dihydrolipoamide dehydrogenase (E3) component